MNLALAQVGIGTTTPDSSAALEIASTSSGVLIPRMTLTERNLIPVSAAREGLLIYQTNNSPGFYYYTGVAWVPFGSSSVYTFTNGLSETAGQVKLGGDLVNDTNVTLGFYDMNFVVTSFGDFNLQKSGENRFIFDNYGDLMYYTDTKRNLASGNPMMHINAEDDYINFGDYAFKDSDDGDTFSDSGNATFTKDFVLGVYSGESGGTAINLGSIEYIVDGTNEIFLEASAFSPMTDLGADLGAANPFQSGPSRSWDDVYANNIVTPSGVFHKTNGKVLESTKGLAAVLALNPLTYATGTTTNKVAGHDAKLGFDPTELVKIVPEAVKTSDWRSVDESGKKVKITFETPVGIMYSQLIPVTIKAIQEQQTQIEELKLLITELKKQNEILLNTIRTK